MKKRIVSLLLALSLILSMIPTGLAVEAVGSGNCGESVFWELDSEGTLTISGTGIMSDYASASESPWYSQRSAIEKIVVEDGVTAIGDRAFYNCNALTEVTIGSDVIIIGTYAFQGATALQDIIIPANVTELKASAFRACANLKTVTFVGDAPVMGNYVFDGCAENLIIQYYEGSSGYDVAPWTNYACQQTHNGQWIVDVPATCTTNGSRHIDCTYCNETITEVIPAFGHQYVDGVCTECEYAKILYSGTCGTNVTWKLDAVGTLSISGSGNMVSVSYICQVCCDRIRSNQHW